MAAAPQNPNEAIDLMGPITATHIVLMVALAIAAVLVIWWGTVLRHRRSRAEEQVAENFEAAEEQGATADPEARLDDDGSATLSADVPPAEVPPASAGNLTQIKGLGPKVAALLAERGITRLDQLAALDPAQAAALDADLGSFRGRMMRDRWVEQAKLLSAGDRAGYEAAFGKLGA